MVTYNFDEVDGQVLTFNPSSDLLRFYSAATAASITLTLTEESITGGTKYNTVIGTYLSSFTLDDTNFDEISLTNSYFADGSVLAIGDLTSDSTAGASDNTIDFTTDPSLIGALDNNNQVHGLDGADIINLSGASGNNLIYGGQGGDTITSGNAFPTIFGGSSIADTADGADVITLGTGSAIVYANAGADTIGFSSPNAGGTSASIYGGLGADSITADGSQGTMFVNAGPDADIITLTNSGTAHTVYGGDGGDTINLSGLSASHTVYGGVGVADSTDGADTITLGTGNSTVYGNAGADTITINAAATSHALIYAGLGADSITAASAAGSITLYAGPGSDVIDLTGHTGTSVIYGGSGVADSSDSADTIIAGSGSATIYGNAGGDVITVSPSSGTAAYVYGGAGADTIMAAPTSAQVSVELYGNTDNDVFNLDFTNALTTTTIRDYGTGTNTLAVTLNGGATASQLSVSRDGTNTFISRSNAETINLYGFHGNFTDSTITFNGDHVLYTNFDGDAAALSGGDGSDLLIAGDNGDTLTAGAGTDSVRGGAGNDRVVFGTDEITSADSVNGGDGTDTLALDTPGTAIDDTVFTYVSNVETLALTTGDFATTGVTLGNYSSAAGITSVDASGATDVTLNAAARATGLTYSGGSGVDSIVGSIHNDNISGNAGDDILLANLGRDTMAGGDGSDIFSYSAASGVADIEGNDTITDFNAGDSLSAVDQFQFSAGLANYNLGNNDTLVDAAIITTVEAAGNGGTELVILTTTGISSDNLTSSLNTMNSRIDVGKGVLDLIYDSTKGHAVIYYDVNGKTDGGHTLVADITNITTLADMTNFDFTDFVFV